MTETTEQADLSEMTSLADASPDELAELDRKLAEDEAELTGDLKAGRTQEPAAEQEENPLKSEKSPEPKTEPGNQNAPKPQDQAQQKDQKQEPEQKPLSKYELAKQKSAEREAKAWQKIEAEKQELARQRAEIEAARRQVSQPAPQQAETDPTENPDTLEAFAEKAEKEGKFDLADLAREKAAELRKNPPAAKAQAQAPAPVPGKSYFDLQPHELTLSGMPKGEVTRAQNELYQQAAKEMPEVLKQGSELNKQFLELAQANPEAFHFPKGPYMLAKMVKAQADASRLPGLTKEVEAKNQEITALQKRVKELEQLTAPGGGDLTSPQLSERSFDQLSLEEQERELDRTVGRS